MSTLTSYGLPGTMILGFRMDMKLYRLYKEVAASLALKLMAQAGRLSLRLLYRR